MSLVFFHYNIFSLILIILQRVSQRMIGTFIQVLKSIDHLLSSAVKYMTISKRRLLDMYCVQVLVLQTSY